MVNMKLFAPFAQYHHSPLLIFFVYCIVVWYLFYCFVSVLIINFFFCFWRHCNLLFSQSTFDTIFTVVNMSKAYLCCSNHNLSVLVRHSVCILYFHILDFFPVLSGHMLTNHDLYDPCNKAFHNCIHVPMGFGPHLG